MRSFFLNSTLLMLFLTAVSIQANAQYNEKILQSANAWADANNREDYEAMAEYTSPRLMAYKGGREKWIASFEAVRKPSAKRNKAIDSMVVADTRPKGKLSTGTIRRINSTTKRNLKFGKPGKIHQAGKEIYCSVPFSETKEVYNKYSTTYGSLLAVSADQGASWTFAEITYADDHFFERFFPTFDKNAIKHKPKASTIEDNPESSKSQSTVAYNQKISLADWTKEARSDSRLLPRYGDIPKTKRQIAADKALVDTYLKELGTPRKASDKLISQGFSYLYKQDIKTAMYRFNQAWLLDSTNADVYWGYGGVYLTLGDARSALKQYDEGLGMDPHNSKILTDKATLYMQQSEATGDKEQLINAIELFKASYAIDPKNVNTLYKLSVAYFIQNDCANANKYYIECKALGGKPISAGYAAALRNKCP